MSEKSPRIKSLEELQKIRLAAQKETDLRTTGENPDRIVLAVGMATCGIAAGARTTVSALQKAIEANHLANASIVATGCFGMCYAEPMVEVRVPGKPSIRYGRVDEALAKEIVEKHVMKGELVDQAIVGREVQGI